MEETLFCKQTNNTLNLNWNYYHKSIQFTPITFAAIVDVIEVHNKSDIP